MKYVVNEKTGRCRFTFLDLKLNEDIDLYYYNLAVNRNSDFSVKDVLKDMLDKLLFIIKSGNFNELFFPVEVEDEYITGVFIVNENNKIRMTYVCLKEGGSTFNLLDFESFKINGKESIYISEKVFLHKQVISLICKAIQTLR